MERDREMASGEAHEQGAVSNTLWEMETHERGEERQGERKRHLQSHPYKDDREKAEADAHIG